MLHDEEVEATTTPYHSSHVGLYQRSRLTDAILEKWQTRLLSERDTHTLGPTQLQDRVKTIYG